MGEAVYRTQVYVDDLEWSEYLYGFATVSDSVRGHNTRS